MSKVQALYARMAKWDFSKVRASLMGFSDKEKDAMQAEYLKFVALSTVLPVVPMFQKADEFWHTHILHTEDYAAFCQQFLGSFFHHRPSTRPQKMTRPYRAFRAAYRLNFGTIPTDFWPAVGTADCGGAGNCSGTTESTGRVIASMA